MKHILAFGAALLLITSSFSQGSVFLADSIRLTYGIPELAYAVVSSDSILEMQCLGVQRKGSNRKANLDDHFRLGSVTKTITAYIAAVLVKRGNIRWNTRFFALYPELKAESHAAYTDMTLVDLLTFKVPLMKWSYSHEQPLKKEIHGPDIQQRYEFISWILKQEPVEENNDIYWSNPAYVAAALMLEKASGKTYETLVEELGQELGIRFGFGQPNRWRNDQPWGHYENGMPEKSRLNYKLNWLSAAGNIHVSLPHFVMFVQMQLQGLQGRSSLFTEEEFTYMHFGLPEFSLGWKNSRDERSGLNYSFHEGNPGTFLSKVFICKDADRGYILFANIQSEKAEEGLDLLLEKLRNL